MEPKNIDFMLRGELLSSPSAIKQYMPYICSDVNELINENSLCVKIVYVTEY